jgi:peptidoglycan lytic transglycosylase G
MPFMPKKRLSQLAASAALLVAGLALYASHLLNSTPGSGTNVQLVDVGQGASLKRVAAELEEKGVVGSARGFLLYARLHGDATRVKAGIYQVNDGMTIVEILRRMVAGEIYSQRFAVPEGYSIYQLAELLYGRGIFARDAFLKQCTDRAFLKELGIAAASVEGYLYPSTYDVTPKMTEADLIKLMVGKFRKVYGERFADRVQRSGRREREVLILASMIEKEAVVADERPLIASVFLNRLKKRMPLQSDPTAVYGVRAFAGKVSKRDILRDSAFNTYKISGLPPGPIGNPGGDAIEAVLNPAATRHLYFVARKDGTHQFSESLDDHNRAVNRYLRSSAANVRTVAGNDHDRTSTAGRR